MKFYVPELALAILSPPQIQATDKFGGLPWGMPVAKWPRCAHCKNSMALIAQLFHHEQRLDLGATGRCLFVFMCSTPLSECSDTFDPEFGANASFVLEPAELGTGLAWPPDAQQSWPVWAVQSCGHLRPGGYGGKVWINVEARVTTWREMEDGVDPAHADAFSDPERYGDLSHETRRRAYQKTKVGGAPCWLQEPPGLRGWAFCAQFESAMEFPPPIPAADEIGCRVSTGGREDHRAFEPTVRRPDAPHEACERISRSTSRVLDGSWCCSGPNYGMGMAYLFLKRNGAASPSCAFMWQC